MPAEWIRASVCSLAEQRPLVSRLWFSPPVFVPSSFCDRDNSVIVGF